MTYTVKKTKKGNTTTIKDACVECGIYHMMQDTCNCDCHPENRKSVEEIFEECSFIESILSK